jgi:prefoldin subunit 5
MFGSTTIANRKAACAIAIVGALSLVPATHASDRCLQQKTTRQAALTAYHNQLGKVHRDEDALRGLSPSDLEHQLNAILGDISQLQTAIAQLDVVITGCPTPPNTVCANAIRHRAELAARLSAKQDQVLDLQTRLNALQAQIAHLRAVLSADAAQLPALQQAVDAANAALRACRGH